MERVMNDGRVWKLSLIFAVGWILAGLAIAFDTAPADGKEFSFPSTPAGKAAEEWFAAMATGDRDILRTFFADVGTRAMNPTTRTMRLQCT